MTKNKGYLESFPINCQKSLVELIVLVFTSLSELQETLLDLARVATLTRHLPLLPNIPLLLSILINIMSLAALTTLIVEYFVVLCSDLVGNVK